MPQAIPFIIAGIKAISVKLAIAIAANVVATAVAKSLAGDPPQPEQAKQPLKQPIPPVQVAYGTGRISGPLLLYVTVPNYTVDVVALCDGPIESFAGFYLNDDYITISNGGGELTVASTGANAHKVSGGSDGRYGKAISGFLSVTPTVEIYWQVGDFPATNFARVTALAGADWPSDARGDGVATVALICKGVKAEQLNKIYPNYEPLISAVGSWSKVYDWRKDSSIGGSGTQRRNDPTTWEFSDNPVVCYVHDEWYQRGQDWDFRFAPTLDHATVAADICDEEIPLKAGGTEPRYRLFGYYQKNNTTKELRTRFIETFDGLVIERGDGAFVIKAGKYVAPTVTLDEDSILECSWSRSRRREDTANKLVISFLSAAHGYTMVEADPWYDLAALESGAAESAAGFERTWVTSNGQVRRLAKRGMARLKSPYQGHVVVRLSDDMEELEQRYFRLKNRRGPPSMFDVEVEVLAITLDLQRRRVRFDVIKADPTQDEWDPETEEGNPPDDPPLVVLNVVPVPTIVLVDVFLGDAGSGLSAPRLAINLEDPERDDLQYVVSWRVTGDDAWVDGPRQDGVLTTDSPPTVLVDSGFVPSVASLDLRVAARASAGQSDWTATTTVNTLVTVGAATDLAVAESASYPGQIEITWRNPVTAFDYVRVFRNFFDDFGSATQVGADQVGALGQAMLLEDYVFAGDYWYWVQAFDAVGGGAVDGPATITVV